MKTNSLYKIITVLSVIGIGLAIYLLWEQFMPSPVRPCTINAQVNCDAIITGPVSKTLGIPTPLIGLTGYIVILVTSLLKKKKIMLGMAAFGLVFCLTIGFIEIFQLKVLCPVCIGCQSIMTVIFGLSAYLVFKRKDS